MGCCKRFLVLLSIVFLFRGPVADEVSVIEKEWRMFGV